MAHKHWIELHVAKSLGWKGPPITYHLHRRLLRTLVIEDRGHCRYFTLHHQELNVEETVEELIALAEGQRHDRTNNP